MNSATRICLALSVGLFACKKESTRSSVSLPFSDNFNRNELGPNWFPSGGDWKIRDGYVYTTFSNNMPLFLNVDLPSDVVMEVDIKSELPIVDAKIELMTDGRTHQSGYVFILGGWSNKLSVIARLDEHGKDRKAKSPTGVKGNETYRWRIEKKGGNLKWYLDGQLYMNYNDPKPLDGPGHNRLGFGNWQNQIRFDNLKIWAYDGAPSIRTSTTVAP